ncbi:MAG: phenylalanine--tRNA ligase subunit alpha [Clostridia bacterium]|nr:phenylalanine--tRNA ligase subunit alpha [Clostridia bacterium]
MRERLEELKRRALEDTRSAQDSEQLNQVRIRYLGKKGELTAILRGMGKLAPEDRPVVGREANRIRDEIEAELEHRQRELEAQELSRRLEAEAIDVTLPGYPVQPGRAHPISQVLERVEEIFLGMGFEVFEGPEVEFDYYNFEALNIPPEHPARDMQDSFYFTSNILLRTHTSPGQIRVMQKMAPRLPVRVIIPGKVYRRDDDATHSPMFHQVEGLLVDEGITFGNLKGTLLAFARQMFGPGQQIRLRPSYFPFTEPSAEVDISCIICGGTGCRTCGNSGWLEILGAGMVHPQVLANGGYDPERVSGFAFGMGIERIAMLKYGIDDLRLFFENDLRFLAQF